MNWMMPSETAPQERVWMAFPPERSSIGHTAEETHEARTAWAAVAHAVAEFEPVTMVVDPPDIAAAGTYLSADIELVEAPLDDAWMRDIGPTFVTGDDGRLGGVDWVFNGWGQQDWAAWGKDSAIGAEVVRLAGAELLDSAGGRSGSGNAHRRSSLRAKAKTAVTVTTSASSSVTDMAEPSPPWARSMPTRRM